MCCDGHFISNHVFAPCYRKLKQVGEQARDRAPAPFVCAKGCPCCHRPVPASEYTGGREAKASMGFSYSPPQPRLELRTPQQECPISDFLEHLRWPFQLVPAGGSVRLWKRPLGAQLLPGGGLVLKEGTYAFAKRMEANLKTWHVRACLFRCSNPTRSPADPASQ